MKREPFPFAALSVVATTVVIFAYFSCSGGAKKTEEQKGASAFSELSGKDLPDEDVGFAPEDVGMAAVLISGCPDGTVDSTACGDHLDVERVGKAD
jgi:hypothetical protein